MKKILSSILTVATFVVMSAGAAQAEPLSFVRAFHPLGTGSSFDSIAFDHLSGDVLVKETGVNGTTSAIIIRRYDHFGALISTSSITGLGLNGDEFDLDVYASPSASYYPSPAGNGGTTAFGAGTIADGTILLFNGENATDRVTALSNTTTLSGANILSTVSLGAGSKIGGSIDSTTGTYMTLNRAGTDKVVEYSLTTGAVVGGGTDFSTQSPMVGSGATDPSDISPDYAFNVVVEGDVAVHQGTGNLYVVSGQNGHHVIRVFSASGTFIKDINLDAILTAAGQSTSILDFISGIAVEPQDYGIYPYQETPWTSDENIWLATKAGWIIHIATDNNQPPEIPEPGTMVLLGIGAVGLLAYRRRQRTANV